MSLFDYWWWEWVSITRAWGKVGHQESALLCLYVSLGRNLIQPIQAAFRRGRVPAHRTENIQGQTTIHTQGQFRVANPSNPHKATCSDCGTRPGYRDGWWPPWDSNLEPLCCEALFQWVHIFIFFDLKPTSPAIFCVCQLQLAGYYTTIGIVSPSSAEACMGRR